MGGFPVALRFRKRNCRSLDFAPNEQKIKPIESISIFSVHFTLNLPQASRLLGMTKVGAVAIRYFECWIEPDLKFPFIPPFANCAKDGAPGDLLGRREVSLLL